MVILPKQASWVAYALVLLFLTAGTIALVVLRPEAVKTRVKYVLCNASF